MIYKKAKYAKYHSHYVRVIGKIGTSLQMIQFSDGRKEIVAMTDLELIKEREYKRKTKINEKKNLGDS